MGGTLCFTADDGTNGRELWKSDGMAATTLLVKDIRPGAAGSDPFGMTNVNGTLYFAADDGTTGRELWRSDGTTAGTAIVRDIRPGGAGSDPGSLTNVGGTLYFAADDGSAGRELWRSDGTAASTSRVADINPGGASSDPQYLAVAIGHLFFAADDGVHGFELWDPPISSPADPAAPANGSGPTGHPRMAAGRGGVTGGGGSADGPDLGPAPRRPDHGRSRTPTTPPSQRGRRAGGRSPGLRRPAIR